MFYRYHPYFDNPRSTPLRYFYPLALFDYNQILCLSTSLLFYLLIFPNHLGPKKRIILIQNHHSVSFPDFSTITHYINDK